ncbi:DedA family protein [Candidatus Hydrogenisulfobacillus filiaventi]|uniref:DedA family protein n=1 Tax=Candidatus Hydrogenisulfobacillus filiaventi TaxID=2707344 RepID=A0A6F8ZG07_9FIRM|nr:DedA family protein [Bacillota bacterium]CAB1128529.1 DedA family protein [Candidatus Hydrogenisulfobacillus filiaventi]
MLHTINLVAGWIHSFGYLAVFVVLFIESLGVPSPSEIILLFSGYLISQGRFSYPLVILAGALGSTAGAAVAYQLAYRGGRRLLLTRLRWIFSSPARITYWENYFRRRGDITVVAGRILSGVRAVISYPAGLFRMPFPRFLLYTFIGATLWPALAAGAGWLLGRHLEAALALIHRYQWPALGLLALAAVALYLHWRWRRQALKGAVAALAEEEGTP